MCLTSLISRGITDPCINAVANNEIQYILLNREQVSFSMSVIAGLENVVANAVNKTGKKGYAFNQQKTELGIKDNAAKSHLWILFHNCKIYFCCKLLNK